MPFLLASDFSTKLQSIYADVSPTATLPGKANQFATSLMTSTKTALTGCLVKMSITGTYLVGQTPTPYVGQEPPFPGIFESGINTFKSTIESGLISIWGAGQTATAISSANQEASLIAKAFYQLFSSAQWNPKIHLGLITLVLQPPSIIEGTLKSALISVYSALDGSPAGPSVKAKQIANAIEKSVYSWITSLSFTQVVSPVNTIPTWISGTGTGIIS